MYVFIQEEAVKTISKYGVGSCGPPGFYGTVGECPYGVIQDYKQVLYVAS